MFSHETHFSYAINIVISISDAPANLQPMVPANVPLNTLSAPSPLQKPYGNLGFGKNDLPKPPSINPANLDTVPLQNPPMTMPGGYYEFLCSRLSYFTLLIY